MHQHRLHPAVLSSLVALLAAAAPVAAEEEPPPRLGVVVTTAVNLETAEVDALAAELGAAIADTLELDVIAGPETRRRLPPEGLPEECVADAVCRRDLGQRLDATELLLVVAVSLGDRIQLDPTWADVATGRVASRPALVLEPATDRARAFAEAAPRLLPHIRRDEPAPREVVVVPTVVEKEAPAPEDRGRHMTPLSWAAVGVAGAAGIGGAVFALSARSKHEALADGGCRDAPCDGADIDSLGRHALAADVLFGVALGAGITGLVLYLRSDPGDAEVEEPALSVGLGPGDGGIAVGGRF